MKCQVGVQKRDGTALTSNIDVANLLMAMVMALRFAMLNGADDIKAIGVVIEDEAYDENGH